MKQPFGNYEIDFDASVFILNYKRTVKDWYDISSSGLFGFICLLVIYFATIEQLEQALDLIYIILIVCFGFVAFWKLGYSIARLLEPTKEIIRIEKKSGNVYIKLPFFRKLKMEMTKFSHIEYHLHRDIFEIDDLKKNRFWIEIELITITKKRLKIININPTNLFKEDSEKTKNELIKVSKTITGKISQELNIKSNWKGIIDEENRSR